MADGRPHTGAEHLANHRTREPRGDCRGFLYARPGRPRPHARHLCRRLQDEATSGSGAPRSAATNRSKVLRVTNPPATITPDAWHVLSEAFKSDERVRVEVRGEEDLLALVCIALAPPSGAVLYGMPTQGVVVVRADETAKSRALDVLRRMER